MGANCSRGPRRRVPSQYDLNFQFHVFGPDNQGVEDDSAIKFVKRLETNNAITEDEKELYSRWHVDGGCIIHAPTFGSRIGWKVRPIHNQYWYNSGKEAIIIVIDSTQSLDEIRVHCLNAGIEIVSFVMLIKNAVIMIVANNQDVEGAHSPEEIESSLKAIAMDRWHNNPWFVVPCRSLSDDDANVAYRYLKKMSKSLSLGQLKPGLIPTAYAWEQANLIKEDNSKENIGAEEDRLQVESLNKLQQVKKSFKNNLMSFKSVLSF